MQDDLSQKIESSDDFVRAKVYMLLVSGAYPRGALKIPMLRA